MLLYQANRALTDFRRKLLGLIHGPILSKVGASTKLGAVQPRSGVRLNELLGLPLREAFRRLSQRDDVAIRIGEMRNLAEISLLDLVDLDAVCVQQ